MELNVEAKRIMAVSISKLYASRAQRGGMRLHRSLLLSVVMRSARDIYHSACLAQEREEQSAAPSAAEEEAMDTGDNQAEVPESPVTPTPEPEPQPKPTRGGAWKTGLLSGKESQREDKENHSPVTVSPDRHSRKRRGKASVAPDFLPSKRARLELGGEERHATPPGAGAPRTGLGYCCRVRDTLTTMTKNRAIAAF